AGFTLRSVRTWRAQARAPRRVVPVHRRILFALHGGYARQGRDRDCHESPWLPLRQGFEMTWRGALLAVVLLPATAAAQADQVATPPPNLVLSNYNSVPVGPYGGFEGAAYVARVDDPSASWFNPAGLAHQSAAQISGSAGVYQRTQVA